MITPNDDVLKAMLSLRGNPDFQKIQEWVKDSLIGQSLQNSTTKDDVAMRQIQGRCLEDKEFIDTIGKAQDTLEQRKKSKASQTVS